MDVTTSPFCILVVSEIARVNETTGSFFCFGKPSGLYVSMSKPTNGNLRIRNTYRVLFSCHFLINDGEREK